MEKNIYRGLKFILNTSEGARASDCELRRDYQEIVKGALDPLTATGSMRSMFLSSFTLLPAYNPILLALARFSLSHSSPPLPPPPNAPSPKPPPSPPPRSNTKNPAIPAPHLPSPIKQNKKDKTIRVAGTQVHFAIPWSEVIKSRSCAESVLDLIDSALTVFRRIGA